MISDVLGLLSLDGGLAVFYIPLNDRARLDGLLEVLVLKLMMVLILMALAIIASVVFVVVVLLLRVLRAQMQSGGVVPDSAL